MRVDYVDIAPAVPPYLQPIRNHDTGLFNPSITTITLLQRVIYKLYYYNLIGLRIIKNRATEEKGLEKGVAMSIPAVEIRHIYSHGVSL